MIDETPPTESSAQPPDHPMQEDSQGTPHDSSENVTNERWESDLDADQMEHLLGDEAIEDSDISTDELADRGSDDS